MIIRPNSSDQRLDDVWDRTLHIQLLDRLTQDGARLVFYDIVFDGPARDPAVDEAFAEAIGRNGRVVLGAALDVADRVGSVKQERVSAPIRPLRRAASGWGLLAFRPVDSDYGVRQMFLGTSAVAAATWKSVELLDPSAIREPRESADKRWINYYGPPDTFASVNIAQALQPEGLPPGFFKDKIVLVGGRSVLARTGPRSRSVRHPVFRLGREIHARPRSARHDSAQSPARRMAGAEIGALGDDPGCRGRLLVGGFSLLRPGFPVVGAALALALGVTAWAFWMMWNQRVWFDWAVPVMVQVPFGLVWSIGSQYLLEARRQRELRKAFGFYLSPEMADKIANSDFDLRPGGKLVDVSVIFTDLENFTTLSEKLDPKEVSEILTTYFGQTTKWILNNRGTIIKYIGDAVFAAWGAPIDEPAARHARG